MYHIVAGFVEPYRLLFLLTGLAIANLWRKRQESRRRLLLLTLAFAACALVSLPMVGYLALASLEWRYPPLVTLPADSDAIVVLSGYVRSPDKYQPHAELGAGTMYRCLQAAEVYHQGKALPVLVSGGKVNPDAAGPTAAQAMRDFLISIGVRERDLITEDESRTTYENAVESVKKLKQRGLKKIILVTEAAHMYRAVRCFRSQGIEVVPAGCNYRATEFGYSLFDFLPSPSGAGGCREAFHEWLGVAYYRLKGWI